MPNQPQSYQLIRKHREVQEVGSMRFKARPQTVKLVFPTAEVKTQ